MKLSVIIPVFNEERTIDTVIDRVKGTSLPGGVEKEIVIVNDGSTDGTARHLEKYQADSWLKIFHQEKNQGKASAVVLGIQQSTGDIIIIQDADLEYDPNDYARLIQPIIDGKYAVVYGSRFLGKIENMTFINRLANIITRVTFNILYGTKMTDVNTCYKIIRKDILKDITLQAQHFGIDTEITAKIIKKGYPILEIPIHYKARTKQEGKKIDWAKALKLYWVLIKLRFIRT